MTRPLYPARLRGTDALLSLLPLFGSPFSGLCTPADVADTLAANHYLGPTAAAKFAYRDDDGVLVFGSPRSRRLPASWLELSRWCITSPEKNAGSRQWRRVVTALRPLGFTTVLSYSDPSQGHTGALYRACNWLWAPTWHRLRPPPSGLGDWGTGRQEVKDRWVYPLTPDAGRAPLLAIQDAAVVNRFPSAEYREPKWRGARFNAASGGGSLDVLRGLA